MSLEVSHIARRFVISLALLAALLAAPLASVADAVTNTSYVTANLAGANGTYGQSEAMRIAKLVTVKNNVAFLAPHGVAAQELCLSDRGLFDSGNELIQAWQTNGAESVKDFETVVGQSFCMSASREGSLIHATVGSFGGVGLRPRNRSGLAV